MDIKIAPGSNSFSPNPVRINTTCSIAIPIYEYVPGQYKISVRYLVSGSGAYYTTRSGYRFLVPVKSSLT